MYLCGILYYIFYVIPDMNFLLCFSIAFILIFAIQCRKIVLKYSVLGNAVMMELADMQDLGSCAERRVGSSPTNRSICKCQAAESKDAVAFYIMGMTWQYAFYGSCCGR